ncbi:carboxypeptidase-like regulatory domain-containing protein [Flavitalea flava]
MIKNQLTLAVSLMLAVLFVLPACKKYVDQSNPPGFTAPDELVKASLQGRVLDENGLPVKGAVVTSGTATTSTDVNGVFTFSNIDMYNRFGFVKVVKAGYFTGSRTILTKAGSLNFVRIDLLPRISKGSFSASSGGKIILQTGDSVAFDAGAVVNATSNAAYSGMVHVFATYLDPTDVNSSKQMPGDLRGVRTDNKETGLQSFGMMVVELEGDGGEKLQIAPGKKATISMDIPSSLQASAPSTIPLWYFNDSTGKWIEEGTGTRMGNAYIGEVGHFSWWNYDVPYEQVFFKARIKDQHGNPLAYTYLQFVPSGKNYGVAYCFTDSSGFAQGLIPKGQDLILRIMDNCYNMLFGTNVGPALNDQDLGTITISINTAPLTLTGKVVDCANNPVENGFVNAFLEGMNYRAAVTKGNFLLNINRCNNTSTVVKLTAGDLGTSALGSVSEFSVTGGSQDLGVLTACGSVVDSLPSDSLPNVEGAYLNLKFNGKNLLWGNGFSVGVTYWYSGGASILSSVYNSDDPTLPSYNITISFNQVSGIGNYPTLYLMLDYYLPGNAGNFQYIVDDNSSPKIETTLKTTVTGWGPLMTYMTGTISGTLRDMKSGVIYPATGSYRVLRTNE